MTSYWSLGRQYWSWMHVTHRHQMNFLFDEGMSEVSESTNATFHRLLYDDIQECRIKHSSLSRRSGIPIYLEQPQVSECKLSIFQHQKIPESFQEWPYSHICQNSPMGKKKMNPGYEHWPRRLMLTILIIKELGELRQRDGIKPREDCID